MFSGLDRSVGEWKECGWAGIVEEDTLLVAWVELVRERYAVVNGIEELIVYAVGALVAVAGLVAEVVVVVVVAAVVVVVVADDVVVAAVAAIVEI